MKLSVVIPAHNEEGCIERTVQLLHQSLRDEKIDHEIVVVDDHCTDRTSRIIKEMVSRIPSLRMVVNVSNPGFGLAVRAGLKEIRGDAVAVFMADTSDSPRDLIRFFRTLQDKNVDCVFGTRFSRVSKVKGYPILKFILNRIANKLIQLFFGIGYNDVTNAFKMYRTHVIEGLHPLLSHHFNLTVELPLKAIVRGYSYAVVPNDWTQRKQGISKLKIKEMGSRYLFIMLYCFIEKWLSRGDYHKKSGNNHHEISETVKKIAS